MNTSDTRRLRKRLLNQIRHLASEAEKLRDRVQALCPEEYRVGQEIDPSADFLAHDWNTAHCAAHDLANSLESVAFMLGPESDEQTG